ncbi:MAG: hypothetical protein KDD03_03225 [Gelidibacter sp.]|nr:hypothetical protein [Gelidibacter sp.]
MKKVLIFLFVVMAFVSCKKDSKTETSIDETIEEVSSDIKELSGNFIYYADAAVFQTKSELFGVVENEKLEELIIQSETLKDQPTDEVAVTLKVKISKKPENEEGWDNRIEIIEIIKVSKVNSEDSDIIKLGTK